MNTIKISRLQNGKYAAWTSDRKVHFMSSRLDFVRRKTLKFAMGHGLNFLDVK